MTNQTIRHFKDISKKDVGLAGGKGASLGEMTQAGFLVPPGFVITAPTFDKFLEKTDLDTEIEALLHKVNHKDINSVDKVSAEVQALIHEADFPEDLGQAILKEFAKLKAKYVAVRSSATAEDSAIASWAGELDTYLNVTKPQLLEQVKKCWASLFTPRAIFYAFEKGIYKPSFLNYSPPPAGGVRGGGILSVSVAVVVQAMIQSEISGICFTVHPVTEDRDQMVIEAGYGLGEAIVGGKVTPDTYVVHKEKKILLDINVGEQTMMIVRGKNGTMEKSLPRSKGGRQKLTGHQVIALAKLCQKIEQHYKKPQDIEWALSEGKFYILQSRPITTLGPRNIISEKKLYVLGNQDVDTSFLTLEMTWSGISAEEVKKHVGVNGKLKLPTLRDLKTS